MRNIEQANAHDGELESTRVRFGPSQGLMNAIGLPLVLGLYAFYFVAFFVLQHLLSCDEALWQYGIAGSGLTIGLTFYFFAALLFWKYLRLSKLVKSLEPYVEATATFWLEVWERRQELNGWDRRRKIQKQLCVSE